MSLWESCIEPALREGLIVLCDRYTLSTAVYQGCGRQRYLPDVLVSGTPEPTAYLVFDLDDAERLRRRQERAGTDVFEADTDFQRRVVAGYRVARSLTHTPVHYVDAGPDRDTVFASLTQIITPYLCLN